MSLRPFSAKCFVHDHEQLRLEKNHLRLLSVVPIVTQCCFQHRWYWFSATQSWAFLAFHHNFELVHVLIKEDIIFSFNLKVTIWYGNDGHWGPSGQDFRPYRVLHLHCKLAETAFLPGCIISFLHGQHSSLYNDKLYPRNPKPYWFTFANL